MQRYCHEWRQQRLQPKAQVSQQVLKRVQKTLPPPQRLLRQL
jgi:hypothetical protein